MIDGCNSCGVTLYEEKDKEHYYTSLGIRGVYCADSEGCRARVEEKARAKRDLHNDQRLSAGQKTRSHYTI
jgi:hypothetical protein